MAAHHDNLALKLTKEKLTEIFANKFYGEQNCFSSHHKIVKLPIDKWTPNETNLLLPDDFRTLKEFKEQCQTDSEEISNTPYNKSLELKKKNEFPLIKGEGQYKCTKGFIDLIIHFKPLEKSYFKTYGEDTEESINKYDYRYRDYKLKINCPIELIIEIKKEKDFEDIGQVLRQIHEYKEYYEDGCVKWQTEIINDNETYDNDDRTTLRRKSQRRYCIIADKIPLEAREIFNDEKILWIDLYEEENGKEQIELDEGD